MDKKTFVLNGEKMYVRPEHVDIFLKENPDAEERDTSYFSGEEGFVPDEIENAWKGFKGLFTKEKAVDKIDNTKFYTPPTKEAVQPQDNQENNERLALEQKYRSITGDNNEDLSKISLEDLKFKIENPLGKKTESGEVVTTDAGGTTVKKDGKVIEEKDQSEEAKKEVKKRDDRDEEAVEENQLNELIQQETKGERPGDSRSIVSNMFTSEKTDPTKVISSMDLRDKIKKEKKNLKSIIDSGGPAAGEASRRLELLNSDATEYIATKGWSWEDEETEKPSIPLLPDNAFDGVGVLPWSFKKIVDPLTSAIAGDKSKLSDASKIFPGLDLTGREARVVAAMKLQYGQFGFDFREAVFGGDFMTVMAPPDKDGKRKTLKVNLYSGDAIQQINNFFSANYDSTKVMDLEDVAKENHKIRTSSFSDAVENLDNTTNNNYNLLYELDNLKKQDLDNITGLPEDMAQELAFNDNLFAPSKRGTYIKQLKQETENKIAEIEANPVVRQHEALLQKNAYNKWREDQEKKGITDFLGKQSAEDLFEDEEFKKYIEEQRTIAKGFRDKRIKLNEDLQDGNITQEEYTEAINKLNEEDTYHKDFQKISRDVDYNERVQIKEEDLMKGMGDAEKMNFEKLSNALRIQNKSEIFQKQDNQVKEINKINEIETNIKADTKTIETNTEVLRQLQDESGLKFDEKDADGDGEISVWEKNVDIDYYQDKANKIYESNLPSQKEIDDGAKEVVNKIYNDPKIKEDILKIKSVLPTKQDVDNKFKELENKVRNGTLTPEQGNAQWEAYTREIKTLETNVNNQLKEYEAKKTKEAEQALELYKQQINKKSEAAKNKAQKYLNKQFKKITDYQNITNFARIETSDAYNSIASYNLEYKQSIKKYQDNAEELDKLLLNDSAFNIAEAEAKKIHSMFHTDGALDSRWLASQVEKGIVTFIQNFPEAAQGLSDFFDEAIDPMIDKIFKNNPDLARGAKAIIGNFGTNILFDKDSLFAGKDSKGRKQSMWRSLSDNIDETISRMDATVKPPMSWDDLKAGKGDNADWVEYFVTQGISQIPILATIASTGGWALPLLSINAGGGNYKNLYEQRELYQDTGGIYGQDLSYGQMVVSSIISGGAEGLSEYVTGKIFGRTLDAFLGPADEAVTTGVKNYFSRLLYPPTIGKGLLRAGVELPGEALSEVLATTAQNFTSRYINGDKTVHLLDGWDESAVNGFALAGLLQSPRVFAHVISPFRGATQHGILKNLATQIDDVTKDIAGLRNLSPQFSSLSKKEREEKIKELEKRHTDLILKFAQTSNMDLKRVDLFSNQEKKDLLSIQKRNQADRDLINKTLNDKRLKQSTKDARIKKIEKRINDRTIQKQEILDRYPPSVINKSYKNQMSVLNSMSDMIKKMGGPNITIRELNDSDYKELIKDRESKTVTKDGKNLSKSEIEVETSKLENKYEALLDIINTSKNKREVANAKKELSEVAQSLAVGMNVLNNSSAGVNIPIVKDGKIVGFEMVINKDVVVTEGLFNTAAHEFIHASFANTLKADPKMRAILGGQLQKIIDGDGVTFKPGKKEIFDKRVKLYKDNKQGEEMLAVMAEMILAGDITINNSFAEKATGVFRRFTQQYFNRDIKFDGPESLKKFLTDFNYSFKNNKPSKAIARLLASSDNTKKGELFKDAEFNLDETLEYNKVLEKELKEADARKDRASRDLIDQYTMDEAGNKKYKTAEEFQDSPDVWKAYRDIQNSELIKNLILQGTKGLGINNIEEADTYYRNVLAKVLDEKFKSGPTKNYTNLKNEILEKRKNKEITPKETVDLINKLNSGIHPFNNNKIQINTRGFDATDGTGSIFGFITGVAIPFSKKNVQREYFQKEFGGLKVSTEQQINEGQTIGDKIQDKKDSLLDRIDNITLSDFKRDNLKQEVDNLLMVTDLIKLPTRNISSIKSTIKDADVLSLDDITDPKAKFSAIKNIKNLIIGKELDPKVINPRTGKPLKSEKATIPTGPYFGVLNSVAAHMGIDPLRVLANQDLNNNGRKKAQDFLYDLIVKENGDLNPEFLEIFKGAAATAGGKATGLVGKTFVNLFNKQGRAKKSDTGAGLEVLELRNDITKEELLDMFGMDPNGSKRSGTKADGAIREFSKVLSTLAATQEISINAIENNLASEATIARLKDGRSNAMYSNVLDMNTEQRSEVNELSRRLMGYAIATPNGMMTVTGAIDKLKGRINKIKKDKTRFPASLRKELADIIQEFANADPRFLYVLGTGMTFGKNRSIFGVVQAFKDLSPEIKEALEDVTKAFVYKEIGSKSNRKGKLNNITKDPKTGELKFKLGKQSLTLDQFRQYELEKFDLLVKLYDTGAKLGSDKAYFLKSFHGNSSSQMAGLQRSSAFMTALPINPDGTLDNETFIEQEHMFPQNLVGSMLFISSYKSPKEYNAAMKIIEKSYGQMPLRKGTRGNTFKENGNLNDHNGMVAEAGYAKSMPEFFEKYIVPRILDNSLDYLPNGLAAIVRYTKSGINLNGYQLLDGQTITEYFGVNVKNFNELSPAKQQQVVQAQNTAIEQILSGVNETTGETITKEQAVANVQAIAKSDVIGDVNPNKFNTRDTKFNAALESQSNNMLSKVPPKVQGLSVFDFDDTLGITKSGVQVKMPNLDGKPKPKRKVIFLAGGAGSGKSNVVKKLNLEKDGFKIVNSDISLEWLKKNSGLPADMRDLTKEQRSKLGKLGAESRKIARRKMMKYRGNGNGVVVDGTGGSMKSMTNLVNEFKDKGYDVSMLYVDTSLETALERNRARKERSLLDTIVKRNHESVKNNKQGFKEMFGDTFMEVNTDNLTLDSVMPSGLVSQMNDFVSGYEKRRIDATEFAEQGDRLLREGAEFDFSEFNKVVEGRPGPLLGKALERAKRFGTKDIFVLTARPAESAPAIQQFLKSQGLEIPLQNITGLANSTGAAKAEWMLDKFAEGYNDMYFADDAMQNVTAVKEVLDQLDIKSDVVQAKLDQANRLVDNSDSMQSKILNPGSELNPKNPIDTEFNEMLERKKGMDAKKRISGAEARMRGKDIGRFDFYIPPSAEDFKGLLYYFLGKGKRGDADMKFFNDKLLKPFAQGIRAWNTYKQQMADEFRILKKSMPKVTKSLNDLVPGTNFTNDSAVRVYLWNKAGKTIPGISKSLEKQLVDHVNNNPDLKTFADNISKISRIKEGYTEPGQNWVVGSIARDLSDTVNKVGRKQFLSEWINNKDVIFNSDNMNKIEALYGTRYREALENILYRMENGGNRVMSKDRDTNFIVNWINGAVGSIMFFNMRSALLQTISAVNFINFSDNNIFKATKAFANQPQFWKDFVMLFNSDQLKQRRRGLQTDVSASELVKSFKENGNSYQAVVNFLLEKGFTPTQIADSTAIAFGGASFYRNRYNKYIKEGKSPKEANEQAMLDFQEIAEETQQSSREDLVSKQQASVLGRIILAFQNVTMQYGRLTKKALSDLVNGRGDTKTNISKILYYGAVQNIVFASLQSALAFMMFGSDEDEETIKEKEVRVANSVLDSFLRGTGIYGALASTLKNVAIQWHVESQKAKEGFKKDEIMNIAQQALNLSPPIGSKVRKLIQAYKMKEFGRTATRDKLKYRLENPKLAAFASVVEGITNIPLARLLNKANNLEEAITGQHETWKRVAMALGWSRWELGLKDEEVEAAREEVKEEKKEEKRIKQEEKKEEKRKQKEEQKKKEEEEKKKKGIKTLRCSGIKSNGKRCKITGETNKKKFLCVHHAEFKDGMDRDGDGKKEYRCIATKSNGQRCKNKTENTNKKCYAHQ